MVNHGGCFRLYSERIGGTSTRMGNEHVATDPPHLGDRSGRLVRLRTFTSPLEARLVVSKLESADLTPVIAGENATTATLGYLNFNHVEVLIPENQLEAANELLANPGPPRPLDREDSASLDQSVDDLSPDAPDPAASDASFAAMFAAIALLLCKAPMPFLVLVVVPLVLWGRFFWRVARNWRNAGDKSRLLTVFMVLVAVAAGVLSVVSFQQQLHSSVPNGELHDY
ncbi:MAG: DUF2007 domain-containing protein [Tepidisphaeraceae bacterium]